MTTYYLANTCIYILFWHIIRCHFQIHFYKERKIDNFLEIIYYENEWRQYKLTFQVVAWRSWPIGYPTVCAPRKWYGLPALSMRSSWYWGWGDCAIALGIVCRFGPSDVSLLASTSLVRVSPPILKPFHLPVRTKTKYLKFIHFSMAI